MLAQLGGQLRERRRRRTATAYRIGGDEFAVLLAGGEGRHERGREARRRSADRKRQGLRAQRRLGRGGDPGRGRRPRPPRCSWPTCGCTRRRSRGESPGRAIAIDIDAADVTDAPRRVRGTAKLSSIASRTAVTSARLGGVFCASHEHRRLVERAQQQVGHRLDRQRRESHPPRSRRCRLASISPSPLAGGDLAPAVPAEHRRGVVQDDPLQPPARRTRRGTPRSPACIASSGALELRAERRSGATRSVDSASICS